MTKVGAVYQTCGIKLQPQQDKLVADIFWIVNCFRQIRRPTFIKYVHCIRSVINLPGLFLPAKQRVD